jgi:hypothetical protein
MERLFVRGFFSEIGAADVPLVVEISTDSMSRDHGSVLGTTQLVLDLEDAPAPVLGCHVVA